MTKSGWQGIIPYSLYIIMKHEPSLASQARILYAQNSNLTRQEIAEVLHCHVRTVDYALDPEVRKRAAAYAVEWYANQKIVLKGSGCVDCGYDRCPAAVDFHHRDPSLKKETVATLWGKSRIYDEIENCDLLCANCHRERTFADNPKVPELMNFIKSWSCHICGYSANFRAIDFHHLVPEQKLANIAKLAWRGNKTLLMFELQKTIPLCARCHREHHAGLFCLPPNLQSPYKFGITSNDIRYNPNAGYRLNHVTYPPDAELQEWLLKDNIYTVAERLGMSDNGLRKHCKRRHITFVPYLNPQIGGPVRT